MLTILSCIVFGIQGNKTPLEEWLSSKAAILEKHPDEEVTWNAYPSANQLAESQNDAVSYLVALLLGSQDSGVREFEKRREEMQKRFTNFGSRLEAVPENLEVTHNKPMKAMRYGKKK